MFCKNCGTEIGNGTFCKNCGWQAIVSDNKIIENNNIKYQLKPKFNWLYKFLSSSWKTIIGIILVIYLLFKDQDYVNEDPTTTIICLVAVFLFLIATLILQSMQYKRLCYNFYTTKVEYLDGFLNQVEKELKYKYIREVIMTQSFLERMFNIGKIKIFTNAGTGISSSAHSFGNGNGIAIHCVKDVKIQYQTIKKIIDEGSDI